MPEPSFWIVQSTRKPGECQSRGAAVTWATTHPKGKAMILHGNPEAIEQRQDLVLGTLERIASSDSHWARCPDAKKWKR